MKKRTLALILALIMLLLPVLVSCTAQAADGPGIEDNKESEAANENNTSSGNEEVPKSETNEESKEETKPEPAWKEASKNFKYVPKPDYLYELSKDREGERGGPLHYYTINADFSPNLIHVGLSMDISKLELTPEQFSTPTFDAAAAIEKVEKLGNICFKLTLKDADKQNVLDVIEELGKIKLVRYAEPSGSHNLA